MTPERVPQMEFISMVVGTAASFVFRAPPLSYVSNIYVLPFAGIVWGCAILLVIIGATIVYSTYVLPECNRNYCMTAVLEVILLAAGTASQMGTHLAPKMLSGRISTVSRFASNVLFVLYRLPSNPCVVLVVCVIDWIALHLHIVHGQYCRSAAIDHEFNQNSRRFAALGNEIRRSRHTIQSILLSHDEGSDTSRLISNENRSTKWTGQILQFDAWRRFGATGKCPSIANHSAVPVLCNVCDRLCFRFVGPLCLFLWAWCGLRSHR